MNGKECPKCGSKNCILDIATGGYICQECGNFFY